MAIPSGNALVQEDQLLSTLADSDIQAILTAGVIEALQGDPLDPDAHKDVLLHAANNLVCLAPQRVTGILVRKLLELLFFVAPSATSRFERFTDIQALINNEQLNWVQAWVENWYPGDRNKTYWVKLEDSDGLLPNGTDVLQTAAGFNVVKVFTRPFDPDEITVPPPYGGSYQASVPAIFPTRADFRASFITVPFIAYPNENGILTWWKLDPDNYELGEEGIDWDQSQIAHYRWQQIG